MAGNVDKTMAAPVTAIVAYDELFYENQPKLFPQNPGIRDYLANAPDLAAIHAFRNGSLQGGYFILAARALGQMPERRGGDRTKQREQSASTTRFDGKARDNIAGVFKVSDKSVQQAKALISEAPDLAAQAQTCTLSLAAGIVSPDAPTGVNAGSGDRNWSRPEFPLDPHFLRVDSHALTREPLPASEIDSKRRQPGTLRRAATVQCERHSSGEPSWFVRSLSEKLKHARARARCLTAEASPYT